MHASYYFIMSGRPIADVVHHILSTYTPERVSMCVCVFVCMYMYVCVCVCMCVRVMCECV